MKRAFVCVALACASMGCASSQTTLVKPDTVTSNTVAENKDGPTDSQATIATDAVQASVNDKWLGAASGSQFVHVSGANQFIGVWVDVPEVASRQHVPMALTLTIDTSGSMGGEKIVQARRAAKELVSKMKNGDMVAIHTFSDAAHELVPPTRLNARSRAAVVSEISELSADGATNMHEALTLAISRSRSAPSTHPVRRVVLISDGRATAGPTSVHALADVAERGTEFGVQVTSLGVGLDYDENALNALAKRSSGRLFHLADAKEMPSIIKNELALLQKTMATNAFVELVPAPGVQLVSAAGVRTAWGGAASRSRIMNIPLGTMFSGQRRELLVRFRMNSDQVEGSAPIVSARLHFSDPTDGNVARVQEVVVRGKLTNDMSLVNEHMNPDVQAIVALNEAAALATAARSDVDSGEFDKADQQLAVAEGKLREKAKHAKTARDRARMRKAADSVASNRRAVDKAKKAKPAARAAAARGASLEMNDAAMEMEGF